MPSKRDRDMEMPASRPVDLCVCPPICHNRNSPPNGNCRLQEGSRSRPSEWSETHEVLRREKGSQSPFSAPLASNAEAHPRAVRRECGSRDKTAAVRTCARQRRADVVQILNSAQGKEGAFLARKQSLIAHCAVDCLEVSHVFLQGGAADAVDL